MLKLNVSFKCIAQFFIITTNKKIEQDSELSLILNKSNQLHGLYWEKLLLK